MNFTIKCDHSLRVSQKETISDLMTNIQKYLIADYHKFQGDSFDNWLLSLKAYDVFEKKGDVLEYQYSSSICVEIDLVQLRRDFLLKSILPTK